MNTIEFNGSFIRTKNFMEGGEKLFESNTYINVNIETDKNVKVKS